MLVDFSGDKAEIADTGTGEVIEVEIFVAILGCSGLLYVEATRSQGLESWIPAHEHAWAFYGGVTELTIPDNLKSGVSKADRYEPLLNRTYDDLATLYGTVILPTRVAKPRDKAAVEAGVLTVERWVLAPLRHHRFFSLAELNAAIATQVEMVNSRAFRGETTSRRELFEELEREALRPLPATTFELCTWKTVTVHIDYHVEGPDRRFYSVPYKLVRHKLDMRITATTIEVFKANVRVASHVREHGRRRYITDNAHMPESHRSHAEWTPERFIAWAGTIGPEVAGLAEKIIESRPHPEHAYRSCLGVMSLGRKYGNDRLRAASDRALRSGATSYSSVKSILKENLDRVPLKDPGPVPPPPEHENIRGAEYYAGEEES
jgi:transposase